MSSPDPLCYKCKTAIDPKERHYLPCICDDDMYPIHRACFENHIINMGGTRIMRCELCKARYETSDRIIAKYYPVIRCPSYIAELPQTEEMCLAALNRDPGVFSLITNKTPKLYEFMMNRGSLAIMHLPREYHSTELYLKIISRIPYICMYEEFITDEVLDKLVEANPSAICDLPLDKRTPGRIWEALSNNPNIIRSMSISHITQELCDMVLSKNISLYKDIPDIYKNEENSARFINEHIRANMKWYRSDACYVPYPYDNDIRDLKNNSLSSLCEVTPLRDIPREKHTAELYLNNLKDYYTINEFYAMDLALVTDEVMDEVYYHNVRAYPATLNTFPVDQQTSDRIYSIIEDHPETYIYYVSYCMTQEHLDFACSIGGGGYYAWNNINYKTYENAFDLIENRPDMIYQIPAHLLTYELCYRAMEVGSMCVRGCERGCERGCIIDHKKQRKIYEWIPPQFRTDEIRSILNCAIEEVYKDNDKYCMDDAYSSDEY